MPNDKELYVLDLMQVKRMPEIIKQIEDAGSDVKKPLKEWNIYHIGQTGKMFDKGGRENIKWKPLSKIAKIMRGYRKRGGKRTGPEKILRDTGHLAQQSGRSELLRHRGSMAVRRWNPAPYAETHEFGGFIDIPAKVITPVKARALSFMIAGKRIFTMRVVQPAKRKKVQARPHMIITEKDEQKAAELLERYEIAVLGAR